jgi:hypothetical protein
MISLRLRGRSQGAEKLNVHLLLSFQAALLSKRKFAQGEGRRAGNEVEKVGAKAASASAPRRNKLKL